MQSTSLQLGNDSKWFLNLFFEILMALETMMTLAMMTILYYTVLCRWSEWMWDVGVMKTAMNDIFMYDQQPVIAMITR